MALDECYCMQMHQRHVFHNIILLLSLFATSENAGLMKERIEIFLIVSASIHALRTITRSLLELRDA